MPCTPKKKVNLILYQPFPKHTKKETSLNKGLQTGSLRTECDLNKAFFKLGSLILKYTFSTFPEKKKKKNPDVLESVYNLEL